MGQIKWIKITTDIFDDEKIKIIDRYPARDEILVIWFKLLALAGKVNQNGLLFMSNRIPYTTDMLAAIFNREENSIKMALTIFEKFAMISIEDNEIISIVNWDKHQNTDGMDKIREQTRQRVAAHREKQKETLLRINGVINCVYCGNPATGADHIIATARGGEDIDENKIPCCIECNRIKNDKPLVDFLNFNRERINDESVLNNEKLKKHVTLCNVTNRYIVTDCNALEEDKEKEEDKDKEYKPSMQIADLRARYSPEQQKVIDNYLDILKWTRQKGKIADSVVIGIYKEWEKFAPDKVIYALQVYISNPKYHDKKENYCYGIMRNATSEEVAGQKGVKKDAGDQFNYDDLSLNPDELFREAK